MQKISRSLSAINIEHFFKFDKQHLLADKLQTPDTQHEENGWSMPRLAYTLLFVARTAVNALPYPWEKYLPQMKQIDTVLSPALVQRGSQALTRTIGTPASVPKPRGKPLGRKKGQQRTKRSRFPVIVKSKITAKLAG